MALNQPPYLINYNVYQSDRFLQQCAQYFAESNEQDERVKLGSLLGSEQHIERCYAANHYPPELFTHDRYGDRINHIAYHTSYHELMQIAAEQKLHNGVWRSVSPYSHVERTIRYYLNSQLEAGHGCPITMTFAAIPVLQQSPLYPQLQEQLLQPLYDGRDIPFYEKSALTVGMGMTEKQGGSDVRSNTTHATPQGAAGEGEVYILNGHKWFLSAPMSDLFLMLAQTKHGLGCFSVPRWREDGTRNGIHIQQLKQKMGNQSNASCEVELNDVEGRLLGSEGKGVRTIIDMVAMTRFDCMIGSSALLRQSLVQALHHCHYRSAFGARLIEQPLMINLLCDMAIESECALLWTLTVAQWLDSSDIEAKRLARLLVPVGKYWICKRAPQVTYEAMEVIGGMGVMENTPMPRLYREAPINAIWEGSGNIQCLDVLRACEKDPELLSTWFSFIARSCGQYSRYDAAVERLQQELEKYPPSPFNARRLVDEIALLTQAALAIRHMQPERSRLICENLLNRSGRNLGTLVGDFDTAHQWVKDSFTIG